MARTFRNGDTRDGESSDSTTRKPGFPRECQLRRKRTIRTTRHAITALLAADVDHDAVNYPTYPSTGGWATFNTAIYAAWYADLLRQPPRHLPYRGPR